jgi:hypothetical protein
LLASQRTHVYDAGMLVLDHLPARVADLAVNVVGALGVPHLNVYRSIFGDRRSYPSGFITDFSGLKQLNLQQRATALADIVSSFPGHAALLGEPSGPRPPSYAAKPFANERWFFINGICTDLTIAHANVAELTKLTGRPIALLYNATAGFVADIVECALGKAWDTISDSVAPNFLPLVEALADPSVSLVALTSHSQGTIVAAVMLKILHETLRPLEVPLVGTRKLSPERCAARKMIADPSVVRDPQARASFELAMRKLSALQPADIEKLELYCFANCATSMAPFHASSAPAGRLYPFIESYGNQNDLVARLGILASEHGAGSSRIEGERYFRRDGWGHWFNTQYLAPMIEAIANPAQSAWVAFPENLRERPRFWDYAYESRPTGWP